MPMCGKHGPACRAAELLTAVAAAAAARQPGPACPVIVSLAVKVIEESPLVSHKSSI